MQAVSWGQRPSKKAEPQPQSSDALDSFVNSDKVKQTKRLNLNIPAALHARIKAQCALEGRDMTDVLIGYLEERFPLR
jgi:hypothetical protein